LSGLAPAVRPSTPAARHPREAASVRHTSVFFEYVGKTGMTVTGPVSGRRYRFDHPGSRVAVEPADKPSLAALPQLRRVAGPCAWPPRLEA
jgi:hypothetical protein